MVLDLLDVLSRLSKDETHSNLEKEQSNLGITTRALGKRWKTCVLCASQPG